MTNIVANPNPFEHLSNILTSILVQKKSMAIRFIDELYTGRPEHSKGCDGTVKVIKYFLYYSNLKAMVTSRSGKDCSGGSLLTKFTVGSRDVDTNVLSHH